MAYSVGERESAERDEELLLAVLNSTPVSDGHSADLLADASGRELARSWGGLGAERELTRLRGARDALQALVRGDAPSVTEVLAGIVGETVRTPRITRDGVVWELRVSEEDRLPVEAVLAWSNVNARFPGRLRACANDECNLFLLDHSRPGTGKWCSMATCGNRMKARAHANRAQG
jgi:hypothetical protein